MDQLNRCEGGNGLRPPIFSGEPRKELLQCLICI
jgi:hypothetical protein